MNTKNWTFWCISVLNWTMKIVHCSVLKISYWTLNIKHCGVFKFYIGHWKLNIAVYWKINIEHWTLWCNAGFEFNIGPCAVLKILHWTLNIEHWRLRRIESSILNIDYYQARALRALGLLLADGTPTVGGGKTFWAVSQIFLRKQL